MYCKHMDRELTHNRECGICVSGPYVEPDAVLLKEQYVARMDSNEGYWSLERERKRATQQYAKCDCGGIRRRQERMCDDCQQRASNLHLTELQDWEEELPPSTQKDLTMILASASDRFARLHSSTYVGLYPDDPPLKGKVPSA